MILHTTALSKKPRAFDKQYEEMTIEELKAVFFKMQKGLKPIKYPTGADAAMVSQSLCQMQFGFRSKISAVLIRKKIG